MKNLLFIALLILCGSTLAVTHQNLPKHYPKENVKMALIMDSSVRSQHLSVYQNQDYIQICGFVNNEHQLNSAETAARRGMQDEFLVNDIIINKKAPFNPKELISNHTIKQKLKKIVKNDFGDLEAGMKYRNGVVQICGFISDRDHIEKIIDKVKSIKGIIVVIDNTIFYNSHNSF